MNYLFMMLSLSLVQLGNTLKNKDADTKGADDSFGNILLALAPAATAFQDNDENALKKSLRIMRDIINGFLGE